MADEPAKVFCKDDAHAEEVVTTIREVFGKGNDFVAKITYTARDPKGHLQAFRTSASLRVAVTVDMIATGTDVKPLECVFFMRDLPGLHDGPGTGGVDHAVGVQEHVDAVCVDDPVVGGPKWVGITGSISAFKQVALRRVSNL